MIEIKRVEIRDRATFIPAIALRLDARPDEPLLRRAGFGDAPMVVLIHLEGMKVNYDPFNWGPSRTMRTAHLWLQERWSQVRDGQVVDVEHILGETIEPKKSEA